MNQAQFIDRVAGAADMTKSAAKVAVDAVFGEIKNALVGGDEVRLGEVGKLFVKVRKERQANGFSGGTVTVPQQNVAAFKAFPAIKEQLNPVKGRRR